MRGRKGTNRKVQRRAYVQFFIGFSAVFSRYKRCGPFLALVVHRAQAAGKSLFPAARSETRRVAAKPILLVVFLAQSAAFVRERTSGNGTVRAFFGFGFGLAGFFAPGTQVVHGTQSGAPGCFITADGFADVRHLSPPFAPSRK